MDSKELLILAKKNRSKSTYASGFKKRQEERQDIFDSNWKAQRITEEFLERRYTI